MYCKFMTPCGLCSLKSMEGLAQVKCNQQHEPKDEPPTPEEIQGGEIMTNKEAIEELKGLQEFINGTRLKGEIRAEAFDLAIKALENQPQWIPLSCLKKQARGKGET